MDRRAVPGSLLRSFERHLRAQSRSERTVGNYLDSARLAEAFLEGRGKRLEEATQGDLEDFLGEILRRRSANTAATRYKVLRVLYRWLAEEEELPNLMARMRPRIVPEQPKRFGLVTAGGMTRRMTDADPLCLWLTGSNEVRARPPDHPTSAHEPWRPGCVPYLDGWGTSHLTFGLTPA
jgi:hypothetical protein